MVKYYRIVSFIFLLSVSFSICAKELRPYRLVHADSLHARKYGGAYISELNGNVHFFYGNTEFFTDTAHIFEEEKRVVMVGNVHVIDDTLDLKADRVEYLRKTEQLRLNGDVLLYESHADSTYRTFSCHKIEYMLADRDFKAWNNVEIYDSREKLEGSCGFLTYSEENGFGYLKEDPVIRLVQNDPISIEAEKMEYYDEYKKIVAIFDVNTAFSDYLLTSDFLIYFADEEKAFYRGEPKLVSELFDAEASEVTIYFENNDLKHAEMQDSCLVEYKIIEEGEKENWISSDEMIFYFIDDVISECHANTSIKSSYIQREDIEKRRDYIENHAEGDVLIMEMDEKGYIEAIQMKGSMSGRYIFK